MYKHKYLKYKNKYLELKNNIYGGGYGEWSGDWKVDENTGWDKDKKIYTGSFTGKFKNNITGNEIDDVWTGVWESENTDTNKFIGKYNNIPIERVGIFDTKNNFTGIYNEKIIIKKILKYSEDYNTIDKLKNFKYFTLESYIDIKKMEILKEYFKDSDKWIIASSGINDGLSYIYSFLLSYDKIFKNNIKFPDYENDKENYENDLENLSCYDDLIDGYENIIKIFEKGEELQKELQKELWKNVNIKYKKKNKNVIDLKNHIKIIIKKLEELNTPEINIKDGISRKGREIKILDYTEYDIIKNNIKDYNNIIIFIIDEIINKYNNIIKISSDDYDYENEKKNFENYNNIYVLNNVIYHSKVVERMYKIYQHIKNNKEELIVNFKKYLEDIDKKYLEEKIVSIDYDKSIPFDWKNSGLGADDIFCIDHDIIYISDEMFNNISNIYNLNIIILSIDNNKLIIKNIINPEKESLKSEVYFSKYPTVILLNEKKNEYSALYNENDIITYNTIINIITNIKK